MHEPVEPNSHAELLARYRRASEPDDEAIERALTRVLIRAESESESEPAPAPAPSFDRRAWWIAAAMVLLALGGLSLLLAEGLGGAPALRRSEAEYRRSDEPSSGEAREGAGSPRPRAPGTASIVPVELDEPDEQPRVEPSEPTPTPEPRARRRASEPTPEPAPPEPDPIAETLAPTPTSARDLADESRLLGKARRALAAGDFTDAIDWAAEHARRHPEGLLAEERLMIEAVAWCRSGEHAEGRARLAELERRYGATPASAEIEATCAAD
ncbi:hypothetical protein ACNOYE_10045 [Nannocystaceae bacterium ST9]